jgi:hypothetical protein
MCVCVHCACACALELICAFVFIFVRACVRACARVRACMRAHVSACVFVFAFPSDCIFRARVCSERVCVFSERACALLRCARPPIARRRPAASIARRAPRVGGCARVVAFGATGRARARRPQVSPGRAARPTRDGQADVTTHPSSTPPAPSTSSAATAAPTSRTCGRAPTEVRGRTRSRGGSVGYSRGTCGGNPGVLRGY